MKLLELFFGVLFSPKKTFDDIRGGRFALESYIILIICFFLVMLKSFLVSPYNNTFFANEFINRIVSIANIPQIEIFIIFLLYFVFIIAVFFFCKIFGRSLGIKPLFVAMFSIGSLGIAAQLLFRALKFVSPWNVLHVGFYLVGLWCIILSILAIQRTQNSPILVAIFSFITPASFFVFFFGMTIIFPYLTWLSR